jgi:hypothetical protein
MKIGILVIEVLDNGMRLYIDENHLQQLCINDNMNKDSQHH